MCSYSVGRGVPSPTIAQIYYRSYFFKDMCMQMFFVVFDFAFMQIDVGVRATRPTEATYV